MATYWPLFAHLLHTPRRDLDDGLTAVEFDHGVRWIEEYLRPRDRTPGRT